MTDTLGQLYEILGARAVLLPIPFRKKGPVFEGWQSTTFERTQEPDYQAELKAAVTRKGNIGVLLCDGLVSVDVDEEALVDSFAAKAPFSGTLRSRGRRGCNFWFRMIGNYPNGKNVYKLKASGKDIGEWRCGPGAQTVIWGQHPASTDACPIWYTRIVKQKAAEVKFADLAWPAGIVLPWEKKQDEKKASSAVRNGSGLDKRIHAYTAAVPPAVAGAHGDDQTFVVACALIKGWGLSINEARPYLQTYNQRCEPPWPEKKLEHTLAQAEKEPDRKPRGYLIGQDQDGPPTGSRDPFGPNGEANTEPAGPEITDEELAELDKAELERYRVKDRPFPEPMGEDAFHGICGEIVRIIEPVSEASREAILAQLLVSFGNLIGRGPHKKQAGVHHLNEFSVLVGETAIARKGTAWVAINNLLTSVDEDWLANRMRDGFQSGESIIHAVRDPQYGVIPINKRKMGEADKAEKTLIDEGVSDKRLQMVEEEFARLLTVASRQGNTLSSTLRKAWDAKQWLHTEGKNSPEKATGAHISMIGHVTIKELLNCLTEIENKNGFSNRVLWVATKRSKKVPLPPWINWRKDHPDILDRIHKIIECLGPLAPERELEWSDQAKQDWCKFYNSIKSSGSGVVGAIVARTDAHVLRLTMNFTVLDGSALMEPQHLKAAIAFWQYCERSASWIFGQKTGDKAADKIYWALQHEPKGLTRTKIIEDVFNKHISATTLDMALSTLVDAEMAYFNSERVKGAAKPTQRWFANQAV
jgi:Bifunctional DNA primase/polymerase, N-terminal